MSFSASWHNLLEEIEALPDEATLLTPLSHDRFRITDVQEQRVIIRLLDRDIDETRPLQREQFATLYERVTDAQNGGCTGDVRDRMVASANGRQVDDFEPRTRRAVTGEMSVSLLEKGGRYEVQSASGNRYEVDVVGESCTCPDWQQRSPAGGCKHLRRVNHEIKRGRVPRPDGRLSADAPDSG